MVFVIDSLLFRFIDDGDEDGFEKVGWAWGLDRLRLCVGIEM